VLFCLCLSPKYQQLFSQSRWQMTNYPFPRSWECNLANANRYDRRPRTTSRETRQLRYVGLTTSTRLTVIYLGYWVMRKETVNTCCLQRTSLLVAFPWYSYKNTFSHTHVLLFVFIGSEGIQSQTFSVASAIQIRRTREASRLAQLHTCLKLIYICNDDDSIQPGI
jgi:hypothetical protein